MFAKVLFEFGGNPAHRRFYTFELPAEVGVLKSGQLVVVEGREEGEKSLGIFVAAFKVDVEAMQDPDKFPFRKKIIKKAHKNSLNALVKKRYELFKDIEITKAPYKKYRKEFKNNAQMEKSDIRKHLIRNLIVAAELVGKADGRKRVFRFGNMQMIVKENRLVDLIALPNKKIHWVRPQELVEIATNYIYKIES